VQSGDRVILLEDPLRHGYGAIHGFLKDGRLTVRWYNGDIRPLYPQQLQLADEWEQTIGGSFTNADLQKFSQE
jgi:hypothetical protein